MANLKNFISQFNVVGQCRRYRISLWQCPTFLFLIMGLIIIIAMAATYFIARLYTGPEIVILLEAIITSVLFIIGHLIIQGFDGLAKLNATMSDFISIASHQLRTPLTHLRWTIELLLEDKNFSATPKQLEHLAYINNNSKRMVTLVNDLLNVSRIERGSLILKPDSFSMEKLITDLINDFASTAQAHNISFETDFVANLPQAYADSDKIHEVLQNLIDNAIRYTPNKGNVLIKTEKKNGLVLVTVKDSGVGIPEEDYRKIFQKFFRSPNAMKYQTEGSGLGLFIARGIIKASGGRIGFVSEEGQGTTFWFTLPIVKP